MFSGVASANGGAGSRVLHPDDYLRERFVIRAYSKEESILDAALVGPDDAIETIERFFAPETAFLHVRFPTYGCFSCRIDRE